MEYQDYYAILGVPRNATEKEIRSAYRRLARQYHPDVNPGNKEAEERFKKINEAYEVLSDPEKRRKYDELGARWKEYEQWQRAQQAAGTQAPPFEWFVEEVAAGEPGATYRTVRPEDLYDLFGEESPFSEFFETFFGGGSRRGRPRPRRGADVEQVVEVTLAEAYRGTSRVLTVRSPDGQTRRLEVTIPPGVDDGSRIRLAGQGQPGRHGGPPGDLYVVTTVRPDPRFERRGADLYTRVTVPLDVALLGGEARVPTPDGRTLALTIPPGSQDGRTFRLRGQGMPRLDQPDQRGDLYAEVHVQLPERLSPRQRELLEEFARALREAPTAPGASR
ncbi:MAG TPA: J domain-containing protein [Chloroflexota bacterium]|nr:J domain-containing protein [Chloroflexota bacterium]